MARHKRPPHPVLETAREYLDAVQPEMHEAELHLRQLDGPPDAPRFAVTAEVCETEQCPYQVPKDVADAGDCPIQQCDHRCTIRILFDRDGSLRSSMRSGVHWGDGAPTEANEIV